MDLNHTPEEKFQWLQARIRTLQNAEQRQLNEANKNITAAAMDGERAGQHCVVNPQRLPKSPVEVSIDYLELQLLCSTRAFVYSFYAFKLEEIRATRNAEETVQMVQRALSFALARKASDRVSRSVSWVKTGAAEAQIGALGELQLLFLEAETGDTFGEHI